MNKQVLGVALASRVRFTGMAYPLTVRGLRRVEASQKRPHPCVKQNRKDGPPRRSHRIERRPPAADKIAIRRAQPK